MTIDDLPNAKAALRRRMRLLLRQPPQPAEPTCEALDEWLAALDSPHCIASYAALPDEVDLLAVTSRHPQHRWVYPRVDGDHLDFHMVADTATDLAAGAFGILEPLADLETVAVTEIDLFLCPGLAFDPSGGRLGRGRGFYDRVLEQARPDSLKIGICRPFQMVGSTHGEPHDVRMDRIICGR